MSNKSTTVSRFKGENRTAAPKHDVVMASDDDLNIQIQQYADEAGITFDEAASAFASRGVGRVKSEVRKSLRGR